MPRNFECRFPCEEVLNAPINFPSPISIMGSEMADEMMAKMTQMLVHSILSTRDKLNWQNYLFITNIIIVI